MHFIINPIRFEQEFDRTRVGVSGEMKVKEFEEELSILLGMGFVGLRRWIVVPCYLMKFSNRFPREPRSCKTCVGFFLCRFGILVFFSVRRASVWSPKHTDACVSAQKEVINLRLGSFCGLGLKHKQLNSVAPPTESLSQWAKSPWKLRWVLTIRKALIHPASMPLLCPRVLKV